MSLIKKIIFGIILIFSLFGIFNYQTANANNNVQINTVDNGTNRNSELDKFGKNKEGFFSVGSRKGGQGIFYTLVSIAHSLKNAFFWLATAFYLIIVIRLLVATNTEDQVAKFKKGIIWITIGLMIMQISYAFTFTLYAKHIGETLAFDLINNIINPIIGLMEVLASMFFIAIAIFAFYRMVTANGKEEEISKSKMSIAYAIMGFILIKIATVIVNGVYGKLECKQETIAGFDIATTSCIGDAKIGNLSSTIMQIINWVNSLIGIMTVLLIIYAGFNILFSAGDEEKIKKGKKTIIYIAIGLLLLTVNYLLLTFFIIPEATI